MKHGRGLKGLDGKRLVARRSAESEEEEEEVEEQRDQFSNYSPYFRSWSKIKYGDFFHRHKKNSTPDYPVAS
jgi:hypothetical protein